ncbi:hypothetical protein JWH04_16540 [Xanthomonas melonis]|nr:hypothetical protein [Xanthomonas melonis]
MQKRHPLQQPVQLAAGRAAEHMQRIGQGPFKSAATEPTVVVKIADHQFHCLTPFDPAPLPLCPHIAVKPTSCNSQRVCSCFSVKVSSYGLPGKLHAPTIRPLQAITAMLALTPDSYD